jgi:2-polyprenyl-6-methoxyphenol hydroxylase-like FAD-dependent oxidoreductase
MAGLLAARVLTDHFDRVVLVERDLLPDVVAQRKGVPQGRQIHILLARGLLLADRFFPGYAGELEAAGAVPVRLPRDLLGLGPAGWMDRRADGWRALGASRPLIEATVRRRLRQLAGVTVLDGHEVTGLAVSANRGSVGGVRVRPVGADGDAFDLEADLVVDAAGRGSRAPAWLAQLGYPAPEQSLVDANIAYASRVVRIPDGFAADWKLVMVTSDPPTLPRSGYLLPIEGGQWMVGAFGAAGQHPPTDEDGYTAFLRSLRHPIIADAVRDAEPVTPVRAHHGTVNRQWHFERVSRWPERFVVLGDAVCAFNPIYGQGMSVAAIAAETLGACLGEQRRRRGPADLDGLAARFQRALARTTADAWLLSTGEDLRLPTTTGMHVGPVLRARHHYLDRVARATTTDAAVADAYLRVFGMIERPTVLFRPRVLLAAARARGDGWDGGPPPSRPPGDVAASPRAGTTS